MGDVRSVTGDMQSHAATEARANLAPVWEFSSFVEPTKDAFDQTVWHVWYLNNGWFRHLPPRWGEARIEFTATNLKGSQGFLYFEGDDVHPVAKVWRQSEPNRRGCLIFQFEFSDNHGQEFRPPAIIYLPVCVTKPGFEGVCYYGSLNSGVGNRPFTSPILLSKRRLTPEDCGCIFRLDYDSTNVSIFGMPDGLPLPQQSKATVVASSVLELLEKGAKLEDIRKHMRDSIAPAPEKFTTVLNKWLAEQDPPDRAERMTLGEKQAIAEFLTLVADTIQKPLFWRGEECRVESFGDPDYEAGYLRVRPPGSKKGFTKAKLSDILKEAPFGFDRESSLPSVTQVTDHPEAGESGGVPDQNWARSQSKRKSANKSKKPQR
jgi:hypothetical protein